MSAQVEARRCHCCGEPFDRCRETYRGAGAQANVPAALDALDGNTTSLLLNGQLAAVRTAVAELIAADIAYDAAIEALRELNRKVAEQGWLEVQHDALRAAGHEFVRAQSRRRRAIAACTGGAE